MNLYCCACKKDVPAQLTNGAEIYQHRRDLSDIPFWRCDTCKNYVGCHHKTLMRTRPLGCIPTPAIKESRNDIHAMLDPIWQRGIMSRSKIYSTLSKALGRDYHTADIRSIEDAQKVRAVLIGIGEKK